MRCPYPYTSQPFFFSRPWLTATLLFIGLVLFTVSILSLSTHTLLYPLDQQISAFYSSTDHALPGNSLALWTYLANFSSIAPMPVVAYLCYRWLRKKCDDRFTLILASYGVGVLIFFLLALGINRQRPSLPGLLKDLPFPSFPSGHMIQTLTLLVPILYIYLPRLRSRISQVIILLFALAYTLLVGYDRLLLNAHYLTDVLAGTGIGLLWSVVVLLIYERYHMLRKSLHRAAG